MAEPLIILHDKPQARCMIAGWRRQWSNGGAISGRLPRYLIEKLGARKIGQMSSEIATMCYPFQVAGTHDVYRPQVAYRDGLPQLNFTRENNFYDAGNGLIVFLGEEPWYRIDLYGQAFFQAVRDLGIPQTVAVEGVNGPAPPELERRISCVYSKAEMRQELERYSLRFSSYGSEGRQGPTIGMAMVTMAHFEYPDVSMFRLGAMVPMYPFVTSNNEQVGISRDHRAFYDIMRRLKAMFKLEIDLSDLQTLGENDSRTLQETLDRIASTNPGAKEIIERVRQDYNYVPFVEPVSLDPALDRTLEDILRNMPPEQPS
ncbi:MAG: PAC2 family protein [SAR202 cluster bacterium]|nr:PAC2 family protein [SAR202 cluster bacterium]